MCHLLSYDLHRLSSGQWADVNAQEEPYAVIRLLDTAICQALNPLRCVVLFGLKASITPSSGRFGKRLSGSRQAPVDCSANVRSGTID
jgi:hypothetical protein